jgi:hypothetical protein
MERKRRALKITALWDAAHVLKESRQDFITSPLIKAEGSKISQYFDFW